MEEICKFIINDRIYTIYDVDKIDGKKTYVGRTNYDTKEIYIEKENIENMLLTLKHELMHVWMYENGYTNQYGNNIFSFEEMCEYVALSNNSINRITDLYINTKKIE